MVPFQPVGENFVSQVSNRAPDLKVVEWHVQTPQLLGECVSATGPPNKDGAKAVLLNEQPKTGGLGRIFSYG